MGERVIPSRHRVQVTVSLRVPESGYNRNLGVFQVIAYLYLVSFRLN
jgi:seipin